MNTVVEKGRGKYRTGVNAPEKQESETVSETGNAEAKPEIIVSDLLSDIPLPENGRKASRSRYNFEGLEKGKSFFVQGVPLKSLSTACSNQNKKFKAEGRKFITREYTYEGKEGVMVWRVE